MTTQTGGTIEVPEQHLLDRLERLADEAPDRVACSSPGIEPGATETRTRAEWLTEARRVAGGLDAMGVRPGDRVALLSDPRPEWKAVDWAIQSLGAISVPIITTLPVDNVGWILADSEPSVLVVERGPLERLAHGALAGQEHQPRILLLPGPPVATRLPGKPRAAPEAIAWPTAPAVYEDLVAHEPVGPRPAEMNAPALIIYTSGTTGTPKGAMLSLRNLVAASIATGEALSLDEIADVRLVAFLPMAHVAGYMAVQTILDAGGVAVFSHPKRAVDDLATERPTVVGSVPRMFERIVNKMHLTVADGSPIKRRLFAAAERTALARGRALESGRNGSPSLRLRVALFERLVFGKLRGTLGFDRVEAGLVGAAAVRPDLIHFFQGIGVPLVEGYGLTETTAVATSNEVHDFRTGSVGRPIKGMTVRIDDGGEVLCRGAQVFLGYWQREDETEAAFVEEDGQRWFKTGDIGHLDEDGRLSITDRAKELEILDTGKNVAPVLLENALKRASPLVAEALAIGHGRPHMSALIQPDLDALKAWAEKAGQPHDATHDDVREGPTGEMMTFEVGPGLLDRPEVQALFEGVVEKANEELAPHERIRSFALVPTVFTTDRGEMTPTFKKKRKVIREHHDALVATLFA